MVDTGIQVDDAVLEEFNKLRMKRTHRHLILKISDDKSRVEIEHIGEREATFEAFRDLIPKDSCRYGVFELEYQTPDGRTESKILFILYAPDICDSAEKFLYASTKEKVKKKVSPVNKELQVNDWADLDEEAFMKILKH